MSELTVMDRTGDTKIIWDVGNEEEVAVARDAFTKLKKKGFLAYSVKKGGEKGSILTEFDPAAEKIIMSPPMAGG